MITALMILLAGAYLVGFCYTFWLIVVDAGIRGDDPLIPIVLMVAWAGATSWPFVLGPLLKDRWDR